MAGDITFNSFSDFADSFLKLFSVLGWAKALTICFFFLLFGVVAYLLRMVIAGKNEEIDRLRADNDRYREVYLRQNDEKQGFMPPSKQRSPSKKPKP